MCFALIIALITNYLRTYDHPIELFDYEMEDVARFHIHHEALKDIKKYAEEEKIDFYQLLVEVMVGKEFELLEWNPDILKEIEPLKASKDVDDLKTIYKMVIEDLAYFPIPENVNEEQHGYYYVDSWEAERSYGGERKHYGTDIMDEENKRGYFPIISMTDGIVEKIGWLEKGGYRIGVRSPSDAYFYYAHLYSFAEGIQEGDQIKAGQIIGFMGDTGYGVEEGTIGQFDVHLHLGISLPLKNKIDEEWINPYWILKYLEDNRIKSWY
jgi:murein DD-endopeptidase MepM/ murein hydrolase activator NlpD